MRFHIIGLLFAILCTASVHALTQSEFDEIRQRIMGLIMRRSRSEVTAAGLEANGTDDALEFGLGASSCTGTTGGKYYDLSRLKDFDFPDATDYYILQARLCSSAATACTGSQVALCQAEKSSNGNGQKFVLARFDKNYPKWSPRASGDGAVLQFANGDTASCSGPRKTTWEFVCDPEQKTPSSDYMENGACNYQVTTKTMLACPTTKPKSGMSNGTIFLIIVLVVVPVYIIAGCVWNYKKHDKRGWEACPNRDFWRGLCINAKIGAIYTWGKLRGLCSGQKTTSHGEYERT